MGSPHQSSVEGLQAAEEALGVKEGEWGAARRVLEEQAAQLGDSLHAAQEGKALDAENLAALQASTGELRDAVKALESEKEVLEGTVSQLESHLADAQKQSGASERLEGELAGKAELVARLEHDLNSLQGQVAGKEAVHHRAPPKERPFSTGTISPTLVERVF